MNHRISDEIDRQISDKRRYGIHYATQSTPEEAKQFASLVNRHLVGGHLSVRMNSADAVVLKWDNYGVGEKWTVEHAVDFAEIQQTQDVTALVDRVSAMMNQDMNVYRDAHSKKWANK